MKTPEEKYLHDPYYRMFVDTIIKQLEQYNFTPSEVREMAIFACTRFEMTRVIPWKYWKDGQKGHHGKRKNDGRRSEEERIYKNSLGYKKEELSKAFENLKKAIKKALVEDWRSLWQSKK